MHEMAAEFYMLWILRVNIILVPSSFAENERFIRAGENSRNSTRFVKQTARIPAR